jgi:hypothetical protein
MGVRGEIEGVFWMPRAMRWVVGIGGVLSSCEQAEMQKGVLQAIRADRCWDICSSIDVSRRTWEGWEQGRQIPADKVMLLHDLISSPNGAAVPPRGGKESED